MPTDQTLTELIQTLHEMAWDYDPTHDYKLPIDNDTWMEHARQAMKEKLEALETTPAAPQEAEARS